MFYLVIISISFKDQEGLVGFRMLAVPHAARQLLYMDAQLQCHEEIRYAVQGCKNA